MKVKCIKAKNTKLIEGQIYEALDICGKNVASRHNGSFSYEMITLKNGDTYYNLSRFSTLDDKTLDNIDLNNIEYPKTELYISEKNIEIIDLIGQWVYCTKGKGSKYFVKGNFYKVEDVKEYYSYYYKLKIEGFDNYYTANRFRLLSKKQIRELKIDIINGIEIVSNNFDRKFEVLSSDKKISVIFKKLINAKEEMNKNNLKDISIEDYIIEKDKIYGINKKDIEEIKKLKIADLFKV